MQLKFISLLLSRVIQASREKEEEKVKVDHQAFQGLWENLDYLEGEGILAYQEFQVKFGLDSTSAG